MYRLNYAHGLKVESIQMINTIKSLVKRTLAVTGLEIKRIESSNSEEACVARLLAKTSPTLILDVGANEGQYAEKVLQIVPNIEILSFEPLSSAHGKLTAAARKSARWSVHERCAVGDSDSQVEINISGNSVSSSIVPMEDSHRNAAPDSAYVGSEKVPVVRLDSALSGRFQARDKVFLKIDTQGYEKNVLTGAAGILKNVVAVQLELSLIELYTGQALAFEMIEFMRTLGFSLFALVNAFSDPDTGELLQVDAFFIKK